MKTGKQSVGFVHQGILKVDNVMKHLKNFAYKKPVNIKKKYSDH